MFVCLAAPSPPPSDLSTRLAAGVLSIAPRVRLEPGTGVLWADARDLDGPAMAAGLLALADGLGWEGARAGIASTPIAARVAAGAAAGTEGTGASAGATDDRAASEVEERCTLVPPGQDRDYLASHDVGVLDPPPPPNLFPLLAAVGIRCCGDLARLDRESVEVRFGADGVRLWRLARADDPRPVFGPRRPDLPSAELEWVDFELDRQEQVLFIVNALLGSVCDALAARGQGAHAMALEFALTDRTVAVHPVRCSAPTAQRPLWLRIIRAALEPVTFAAPVTRIGLRVEAVAPLADRQGDLFDRGFATARATEAALAQLLDRQADSLATAERTAHPLAERRVEWKQDGQGGQGGQGGRGGRGGWEGLALQLAAAPRPVEVRLEARRDTEVPVRYRDGLAVHPLAESLGPDRVSGGYGDARYDREYFQGVRADGTVVLLYRDVAENRWFLGGWWD